MKKPAKRQALTKYQISLRAADWCRCWLYETAFNIQINLYLVADHDTTAFNGSVPGHSIILTVQRCAALDANAAMALAVIDAPANREGEFDLLRYALHSEIADRDIVVAALLNPLTLEGNLRILVRIKEVRATQILVAVLVIGVNA